MNEPKKLFDFCIERVEEISQKSGQKMPQAFPFWFANMYFSSPRQFHTSDGSGDGKIDTFFITDHSDSIEYHVINSKFTKEYGKLAPVSFYDEITRFWQAFANKSNRSEYLKIVKPELRKKYSELFTHYDNGKTQLIFLTNHRRNENQYHTVKKYGIDIFHWEDLSEFIIDHIENAMPHTPDMLLTGINSVLSPETNDTEVPTSIVFARLVDLVKYMENDPYDLLFARNVRLWLKNTPVNKEITQTFKSSPKEFAFSNNGITMLCATHRYDPGKKELWIENPRVVNGSQTLHSVRDVENPSRNARVMLKIIQIPPSNGQELSAANKKKRDIINKISIRTNRQNPIKKWDLVSNDAFQNEIARYFRQKKLFYERRQKEWTVRSSELKSGGIQRGPSLKELSQFIASYYFDRRTLGPAIAKQSAGSLFEEKPYSIIQETPCDLVYQIFLFNEIVSKAFRMLAEKFKFVRNYKGHATFALFSLLVSTFKQVNFDWEHPQVVAFLEKNRSLKDDEVRKLFLSMTKEAVKHIIKCYEKANKRYQREEGIPLTLNNYFKSNIYVNQLLNANLPQTVKTNARKIRKIAG